MVSFSGILDTGRRSEDDERQINRRKRMWVDKLEVN